MNLPLTASQDVDKDLIEKACFGILLELILRLGLEIGIW